MSKSRGIVFAMLGLLVLGTSAPLQAQTLEEKVEGLIEENKRLWKMVEDLRQLADRSEEDMSDEGRDVRSAIEGLIDQRIPHESAGARPSTLHSRGIDRIRMGGEWRTRGDWRINTTDLTDANDDEGFRLDYRFNLGFGFDILGEHTDDGPDRAVLNVRTWFEVQSAGRAANNSAQDFFSDNSVSVEDFVTRDNDLDIVRLYQAFIELENMFGVDHLNLKVGRQELTLGSQMLLGSNEFFTGTVHDAIRLDFAISGLDGNFTVFYAKEASPDGMAAVALATGGLNQGFIRATGDEDEFAGIHASFGGILDGFDLDTYYYFFHGRGPRDGAAPIITSPADPAIDVFGRSSLKGRFSTIGFWFRGNPMEELFLSVEVAFQWGDGVTDSGTYELDSDYDAFAVEFAGEWNLPFWEEQNARLYFGYYFAEGPDSGFESGFQPLFMSRHNNLPFRDGHGAFSRLGNINMIPTQNIHVFQIGFKFEPSADWLVGITYLNAIFDHSGEQFTVMPGFGNIFVSDRHLGHEIDLYARHTINQQTELFINLSVFIPETDFLVDDPTAPPNLFPNPTHNRLDTDVAFGLYAQIRVSF